MIERIHLSASVSNRIWAGFLVLIAMSFWSCSPAAEESGDSLATTTESQAGKPLSQLADHPVLLLDEAHNALWQDSAQVYLARPNAQLTLNQGDYAFHIPSDMNRPDILKQFGLVKAVTAPNIVHVLYNDNLYKTPWMPTEGKVALRAGSLGGGQNNRPIEKFDAGNTVFIFIGYEGNAAEAGAEAPFAPFYALRVLLDENPLRFIKQPGQPLPIKKDPTVSTKP